MKRLLSYVIAVTVLFGFSAPLQAQDVIVMNGLDDTIALLSKDSWWDQAKKGPQPEVPRTLITGVTKSWQKESVKLPVPTKKEIFYSAIMPLVVHANTMVRARRERLKGMEQMLAKGNGLSQEDDTWLRDIAVLLRIGAREEIEEVTDPADLRQVIDRVLYRLDEIPEGLVLGQAAYESGYGTSRFAVTGNALFGQWTYGGTGMVPEQQRKQLGDHRIASYEWPFDSVRGYYINLSSHPAYEEFRRLRAKLRAAGKPLSSMVLADGLKNYSERGQAYVNTLKGIMRVNKLTLADGAVFKDEPIRFIIGAPDKAAAEKMREHIEDMRKSGELDKIIKRMRLE